MEVSKLCTCYYLFFSKVYTCVIDPDIEWDASREAKMLVSSLVS